MGDEQLVIDCLWPDGIGARLTGQPVPDDGAMRENQDRGCAPNSAVKARRVEEGTSYSLAYVRISKGAMNNGTGRKLMARAAFRDGQP